MKINREKHKQIILEFLTETFKNKKPALRAVGKSHVYQCYNLAADDTKMYQVMAKMLGLSREHRPEPLEDPEVIQMIKELHSLIPQVFTGRNYITADKNQELAIKRLLAIYPARGWDLFDIIEYKGYFIVYD